MLSKNEKFRTHLNDKVDEKTYNVLDITKKTWMQRKIKWIFNKKIIKSIPSGLSINKWFL